MKNTRKSIVALLTLISACFLLCGSTVKAAPVSIDEFMEMSDAERTEILFKTE